MVSTQNGSRDPSPLNPEVVLVASEIGLRSEIELLPVARWARARPCGKSWIVLSQQEGLEVDDGFSRWFEATITFGD